MTIKEFSELAGRTTQAIYKQLNNRLQPFVQVVDNKKMLEARALKEIFNVDIEHPNQQEPDEQPPLKHLSMRY